MPRGAWLEGHAESAIVVHWAAGWNGGMVNGVDRVKMTVAAWPCWYDEGGMRQLHQSSEWGAITTQTSGCV